jgi:hypothetical protein
MLNYCFSLSGNPKFFDGAEEARRPLEGALPQMLQRSSVDYMSEFLVFIN